MIEDFKKYLDKIKNLSNILDVYSFDASTGAPPGGVEARSKAMGYLSTELFNMRVSEEMSEYLKHLDETKDNLDVETLAMFRLSKKLYSDNKDIPAALMTKYNELRVKSHVVWEEAFAKDDFSIFAPYLDQIIKLKKEMLVIRAEKTGQHPYNILLDDYEPGLTMDDCDKFFAELKSTIVPLLKKIMDTNKVIDKSPVKNFVQIENQRKIARLLAEKAGFDFNRGLIRESVHPFCSGLHKNDVRMTTNYHENDFLNSLYSTLHETGHAIYEQSKSDDIANTILDSGISMGIHESQSRFYENVLGRSLHFWNAMLPQIKVFLPADMQNLTPEQMYQINNIVRPSFIRIEADELTYSLHIMIRYEMERLMFSQDIDVNELPSLWNKKYEEYLGLTPPSAAKGILQDVHWCEGFMGYFPSYAIGSALSSQLMHHMSKEIDVYSELEKGDFSKITAWLTEKIHKYGSIYQPKELLEKSIGEQLDSKYYTDYLVEKFSKLYNL